MDKEAAHPSTFALSGDAMNSLGVFVGQEIDRFNVLLKLMKSSLDLLDRAIEGTVVMSMDLESMMLKFLDNKVPLAWEGVGYPSLKPLGSWMPDLILRVAFLSKWLYEGPPVTFWVPSFYFPQGFMTAALQTFARKTQTPIDTLIFKSNILTVFGDGVTEAPEDGVIMHGIYLQGAKWDASKTCVEDSNHKEPIVGFPAIHLEPVDVETNVTGGCYNSPFYKTSQRKGELSTTGHSTNFVAYM